MLSHFVFCNLQLSCYKQTLACSSILKFMYSTWSQTFGNISSSEIGDDVLIRHLSSSLELFGVWESGCQYKIMNIYVS